VIRLLFVVVALLLAYGFVASLVLGNWEMEPAAELAGRPWILRGSCHE